MSIYICHICKFQFDEESRKVQFLDLPEDWFCPECGAGKGSFLLLDSQQQEVSLPTPTVLKTLTPVEDGAMQAEYDALEPWMRDIRTIAETGHSIDEPMRTRLPVISWDEILILGCQLARLPLLNEEKVVTQTVIGPGATQPLILDSPLLITHMSFGSLSREAHIALAMASARAGTAIGSGEGGILNEAIGSARKYILEYVPNQYSITHENLLRVDAIEIKVGQSCKPGMGGYLPGEKVTAEICEVRGMPAGKDIFSPSRFPDIHTTAGLKEKIDWLREASCGKPIGVKIAAGHIEDDLEFILPAKPDFITIDGRPGSTDAAPKFIKMATSVPTIYALARARRFLDQNHASKVSLIITGGLRISPDFAKALAMGADAVAIGTSALLALGCRQYRICNSGRCPLGITSQDSKLRRNINIEDAAHRVANFLKVSTQELIQFAKITGRHNVHDLCLKDLCTTNRDIAEATGIRHA